MANGLLCGWCMTGHHDGCVPEVKYFEKVWLCTCKVCFVSVELDKEE